MKNIRRGINDGFIKDPNGTPESVLLPQGFYSFSQLKDFLKEHEIIIDKTIDNKITLNSENDLDLRHFAKFIGFEENKIIDKNTDYKSLFSADFLNSLREIFIFCSLIDTENNYSYDKVNDEYLNTELLTTISVDTKQSLNGSYSFYNLKNVIAPVKNFSGQEIEFNIVSGGYIDDYEIFLTLSIE